MPGRDGDPSPRGIFPPGAAVAFRGEEGTGFVNTRRLVITALEELGRGDAGGREWRLYGVSATTPDGAPVRVPLRTFDGGLPVGDPVELEVERRDDARGVSYTLRRPRRGGPGTAMLAKQLGELERRVDRLEQQLRQPMLPAA
jgi:hypothetical protein